eukprot:CAMPEP_0117560672 /NCGR_PEP_ID=MMETSP0784-20121206/53996_1 /TAXON_ID=39447 /ORGANISM="" /LENGTH=346 /DNA_ID=CAMNT_0005358087 /DNA_START=56 /DNA_END=1096 /DNA_ORIENTATION=-
MDASWQLYTGIALAAWGAWGFFSAVAERHLPVTTVFAWHCVAIAMCTLLGMLCFGLFLPTPQIGLSLLAGIGYAQGSMWMINSISAGGPAGIVVTASSLYPVLVLLLNMAFLHQPLSLAQGGGTVVAAASIVCFMEPEQDDSEATRASAGTVRWLGLCMLSMCGFAVWTFAAELCNVLQSPEPAPSNAQGSKLAWQGIGCTLICLVHRPSLGIWQPSKVHVDVASPHVRRLASESGIIGRIRSSSSCEAADYSLMPVEQPADGYSVWWYVGLGSAIVMGLSMTAGALAFLLAVKLAPASALAAIVMITGMYGAVTLLLMRLFMNERLSICRLCGVGLALVACALLC